jgi:hypothetical protein
MITTDYTNPQNSQDIQRQWPLCTDRERLLLMCHGSVDHLIREFHLAQYAIGAPHYRSYSICVSGSTLPPVLALSLVFISSQVKKVEILPAKPSALIGRRTVVPAGYIFTVKAAKVTIRDVYAKPPRRNKNPFVTDLRGLTELVLICDMDMPGLENPPSTTDGHTG